MVSTGRKILKLVLIGGLGLIVLAFVLQIVFNKVSDSRIDAADELVSDAPAVEEVEVSRYPDGRAVKIIAVAPERVPDTFAERLTAAPLSLLPNRAGYPSSDAAVPVAVQRQLNNATSSFLHAWETFTLRTSVERYQTALRPWTVPGSLPDIVSRVESADGRGVCLAETQCTLGSQIYNGARPEATVVDYDGQRAYVTIYLPIRYIGDPQIDPRSGEVHQRSYGLILTRSGPRWLVERAVAETLAADTPTVEVDEDVNETAAMGPGVNR